MEGGRKSTLLSEGIYLAMLLLPLATWKIKDVPNETDDPDKKICRQTGKVQIGVFAAYNIKCKRREISF